MSPMSKTQKAAPVRTCPAASAPRYPPPFQAQGPESLNVKTIIAPQSEVHGPPASHGRLVKEPHFGVPHPRPTESEALGRGRGQKHAFLTTPPDAHVHSGW